MTKLWATIGYLDGQINKGSLEYYHWSHNISVSWPSGFISALNKMNKINEFNIRGSSSLHGLLSILQVW